MFLLILESLGSTELFFILLMALVFFGPRKLPQLSRSVGKNLAEFRRASEDFKRTWEREVALEDFQTDAGPRSSQKERSILTPKVVEPRPDEVVQRDKIARNALPLDDAGSDDLPDQMTSKAPRKQDWL